MLAPLDHCREHGRVSAMNTLAQTGKVMQKEHLICEYMEAREKLFSENTILQAWKKSGIRPLNGVAVFTKADFAPSKNTSNRAHVPNTFPGDELPSDFDPLPMYQPKVEPEVHPETPDNVGLSYAQFLRGWDADREVGSGGEDNSKKDGGKSNDESQMEEGEEGKSNGDEDEEGTMGSSVARQTV
ncbi:hypothetical protein B0H34DRAFT_824739, partial [Crassisporium funariophilum]